MPGFVKKVVRSEYIEIKMSDRATHTFGELLDMQIAKALNEPDSVQEFNLLFEESEWHELRTQEGGGTFKSKPSIKSRPA